MYRKGYGKMTAAGFLNLELSKTKPVGMLICGILIAGIGILERIFCASPYPLILALGISSIVPPVWLMTLLWTVSFFTVGCAGGLILFFSECGCAEEKYKGMMYFLLLEIFEFLWYPTLFSGAMVFLSALEAIAILCLSVVTTVIFSRVSRLSSGVMIFHDIWLVYLLILNFAILFHA